MKKILASLLLAAIILTSFAMVSCKAELEYENGYYYCSKNNVTYKIAPFQFVPVGIGKQYAVFKDGASEMKLFEIEGVEPERWLVSDEGDLFCAKDEEIPTLEQMEIDNILLCRESEAVISIAKIVDKDDIKEIIDGFLGDSTLKYPIKDEVETDFKLRMSSAKYPWLYYSISYIEFVNDVCEYDYPENFDEYEYRKVPEYVKVSSSKEFECRYAVTKETQDKYVEIAKGAKIDYMTLTKPNGDGTFTDYVYYIFKEEQTFEKCTEKILAEYEGKLSKDEVSSLINSVSSAESVNVVEYNYGKYLMYDHVSDKCVPISKVIHKYRSGNMPDETK